MTAVDATKKGAYDTVVKLTTEMAKKPDAFQKQFIADTDQILFYTPLINQGQTFTLQFKAPDAPGDYPFICTFPVHWITMKGIMKVVE